MPRRWSLRLLVLGIAALVLVPVLWLPRSSEANVITAFAPRFAQNAKGDVIAAANTLMTCPDSDPACASARIGTGSKVNNNDFNMVNIDVDGDATTFNSSRATLRDLPSPGVNVLWAGLYWSADTTAGTGGTAAADASKKSQVLFATPATGGYIPITGTVLGVSSTNGLDYACFADVTTLVNTARGGLYTVANVQAGTGADRQAGWILVVVMEDQGLPLRNLVVFDGYADVAANQTVDFSVNGFLAPATGTVNARLGLATTEGDLGLTGDSFSFKDGSSATYTKLSTSTNPADNFHNSTISDVGLVGEGSLPKFPDYINQLGFGADRVQATGLLKNGSTKADIRLSTTGDQYASFLVTSAIDIFEPQIKATKSVVDLNGGSVVPGDVLEYTVTVTNSGPDPATNVVLRDQIPTLTSFVSGSLQIDGVPQSDALGGDQAFFESSDNRVVFNLGTGATAIAGGTLAQNQSSTAKFRVTVNGDVPDARVISNDAVVNFRTATLQSDVRIGSNSVDVTTVNRADLKITKTANQPTLRLGSTATYTLTVSNAGPLPATARVVDPLPDRLAFVSATPSSGSCSVNVRLLTCVTDILPVGGSATIQIVMTAIESGTVENTAIVDTVEPNRTDPDLSNNVSSVQSFVTGEADLAITKTQSSTSVTVGDTETYTLKATNNGPGAATGVVVTDALPPGRVTVESVATSQGNCTNAIPVKCTLGRLEVGASATITIVVRATVAGVLPNAADVTAIEQDPNTDNNTATTGASVVPPTPPSTSPADMSIVKTASSSTATVGQPFTYQIIGTNNGPNTATGVLMSEVLPDGVTLVSAAPTQGSCSAGQQFTCQLGSLNAGGKATVTVVVTPQRAGTFNNLATVIANEPDPDPTNNVKTASASANGSADLSVVKQATPDPVLIGDTLQYRISVRNNGPAEATNVLVEDRLPDGVTLLDVRSSQGTCVVTNIISCSVGTLANGGSARVGITVRVDRIGKLLNAARATADQPDPDDRNNVDVNVVDATSGIEPESAPDLVVTKTASASTVPVGSNVSYTITATNSSADSATNVLVTDVLPQGAVLVSVAPSQGTCIGTGIIECSLGTLAGGASATVTVVVQATGAGPFNNFASVQANESDPNPANNEVIVPGTAVTQPGPTPPTPTPAPTPSPSNPSLTITKIASNSKPFVGDPVTFTITVTNSSTSAASGVRIADPLPGVLPFVSATPSQGSCSGGTPTVCQLGTIAAGQTVKVEIVARTTVAGLVTNTATLSASSVSNQEASVTIEPVTSGPPQDPDPDKDEERRSERRDEEERRQKDQEEEETQGTVVAVLCSASDRRPDEPVAEDDGADPPYVVIVTLDGNQKVRLRHDARLACASIRINAYLEANGEKQSEVLFDADDVKIHDARP